MFIQYQTMVLTTFIMQSNSYATVKLHNVESKKLLRSKIACFIKQWNCGDQFFDINIFTWGREYRLRILNGCSAYGAQTTTGNHPKCATSSKVQYINTEILEILTGIPTVYLKNHPSNTKFHTLFTWCLHCLSKLLIWFITAVTLCRNACIVLIFFGLNSTFPRICSPFRLIYASIDIYKHSRNILIIIRWTIHLYSLSLVSMFLCHDFRFNHESICIGRNLFRLIL